MSIEGGKIPNKTIEETLRQLMKGNPGDSASQIGLKLYLAEVARYPLLTEPGEKILFTLRDQGASLQALRQSSSFADTVEPDKEQFMKNALDDARSIDEVAFLCNLRLPIHVAARYYREHELLDKIQDGNDGLRIGVERFDIKRGARFSTFAYDWIRLLLMIGFDKK